ncbi:MAG: 50S ribosomal protein L20 [bacterium]|jgi:large subunit ribosomal protein L20
MPRTKSSVQSRRRRKKVLKAAKGYVGSKHRLYRTALESVRRALAYAYRDRRTKKRDMRSLWIMRINAAARMNGMGYGRLMDGLRKAGVAIDRKILADLAVNDEAAFKEVVQTAKGALDKAYGSE